MAGLVDALGRGRACAPSGPSREAARLEGSKRYAKELMRAVGVPTAGLHGGALARGGARPDRVRLLPRRAQGGLAGRRQGRGDRPRRARRARGGGDVLHRAALRRDRGGDRGVPRGRGAVAAGGVRRRARACRWRRPRTTSASTTATRGPNTGGMGSYSPVPGIDAEHADALALAVHQPIVDELRRRGTPFHGVLYAGLMMTADGPKVLEYNCRFGDPETQAVLPRLRSDILELLEGATRTGGLEGVELEWSDEWAVTVVLASRRLSRVVLEGRRDPRPALDRLARGGGAARGHRRARRPARDRRRAGAERDGHRVDARPRRASAPTRRPSGCSSTASRCEPTSPRERWRG